MSRKRKEIEVSDRHHFDQRRVAGLVVWEDEAMRELILAWIFCPRVYARLVLVCRLFRTAVRHKNSLWWLSFRRMWTKQINGHNSPLAYLSPLLQMIDRNPSLLTSANSSWHHQHWNVHSMSSRPCKPRLVWVDCSDGRLFIPRAGWVSSRRVQIASEPGSRLELSEWRERPIHEYLTRQLVDPIQDLSAMEDVQRAHLLEIEKVGTMEQLLARQRRIVDHLVEWTRRVQQNHTFCLHWSYQPDRRLFAPDWARPTRVFQTPVDPLDDPYNWSAEMFRNHDVSSGWLCENRCAGLVALPNEDGLVLRYHLLTSSPRVEVDPHCPDAQSDSFFEFANSLQDTMHARAGYNRESSMSRYLLPKVCGESGTGNEAAIIRRLGGGQPPKPVRSTTDTEAAREKLARPGCGAWIGPAENIGNLVHSVCGRFKFTWINYCESCAEKWSAAMLSTDCEHCCQQEHARQLYMARMSDC